MRLRADTMPLLPDTMPLRLDTMRLLPDTMPLRPPAFKNATFLGLIVLSSLQILRLLEISHKM